MRKYSVIEKSIGYSFQKQTLISLALTHRSIRGVHNERLEFLGDSVLNFITAYILFETYDQLNEGELSRLRAYLVKESTLHQIALKLQLGDFLILGDSEIKNGGRDRPTILADAMEALIGAVFLDGGFNPACEVVRSIYHNLLEEKHLRQVRKDAKTLLQELLQSKKMDIPNYKIIDQTGEAHDQIFTVECVVPKFDIVCLGQGKSRRLAEQIAAEQAYSQLTKHE